MVRHFGKIYQICKKMLSAHLDHNPHHRAKFGKDPIGSFWENGAETLRGVFEKLSYRTKIYSFSLINRELVIALHWFRS